MAHQNFGVITVVDGSSVAIPSTASIEYFTIRGTASLTSNWAITLSGTAYDGMKFEFLYTAAVTLAGNHITILGTQMPDEYATKKVSITAAYDSVGVAWRVTFKPSFAESSVIKTSHIIAKNITAACIADPGKAFLLGGYDDDTAAFLDFTAYFDISSGVASMVAGAIKLADIDTSIEIPPSYIVELASAGKLLKFDGVTGIVEASTYDDTGLAYLDGITPGTLAVSKAVVVDGSGQIDQLDVKTTLKKDGVTVTSIANDLNLLAGAAAAGVTNADILAVENLATVASITTNGIEMAAGKYVKQSVAPLLSSLAVNVDTTLTYADSVVVVDLSGSAVELSLPAAEIDRVFQIIVRRQGGAVDLLLTADGTEGIDYNGAENNSVTITAPAVNSIVYVVCYATGTWVVGKT